MQSITRIIKVLLVEDNPSDALLLKKFFAKTTAPKFEVVEAETLRNAIKNLANNSFDIILLDLLLPDSWGLEALEKMQRIDPETPIIVLTGTDNEEIALEALRAGAQDYIVKEGIFGSSLTKGINHAIERKHTIEELRQSEARYRGVIEDQTELICRFLPDRSLTFVNDAYCRYFSCSQSELIGSNFTQFTLPEDLAIVETVLDSLTPEATTSSVEFRVINPEGEHRWQQWNNRAIFQGKRIIEYQAVGRDISDRKEAEIEKARLIASLHESQERFRIVTNSTSVLISMTDVNGKGIFFNQSWLDFTGHSLETELIEDWQRNVHPSDLKYCRSKYQSAFKEKNSFDLEYRLLRHDGQYRWVFHTGVPRFQNNGKFAGFVHSCIDITKRREAEDRLAQQAERNRILAEIIQHIHESLELTAILETAIAEINRFLDIEKVFIAKIDSPLQSEILLESVSSTIGSCCQLSNILEKIIIKSPDNFAQLAAGKIIVLDRKPKKSTDNHDYLDPNYLCSSLVVPIIREKQLWGVLCLQQCHQPRIWQMEEIHLLEQIALQLAIAITQSELYHQLERANQELEKLAVIDSLTGIPNRRKFDEYLASEWLRLAREQGELSLIMCDIDHFKLYNDTYGHQKGDVCLQQVAQAIHKAVKRPADLVARYGGEELAIILPNTNLEGAALVAEQICLQVQALQIPHICSPVDLYITLSLGVAGCIPDRNSSPKTLIEAADHNLYRAKKLGRNRVVKDSF